MEKYFKKISKIKNDKKFHKIHDIVKKVMVERKDTLAFIEFLRGKYKSIYNTEYIQLLFNRLSIHEKEKLIQ